MVVGCLLAAFACVFLGLFALTWLLIGVGAAFGPDAALSASMATRFRWLLLYLGATCVAAAYLIARYPLDQIWQVLKQSAPAGPRSQTAPGALLFEATAGGVSLCGTYLLVYAGHLPSLGRLFREDGLFKTLSAVAFGGTALLTGLSALRLQRLRQPARLQIHAAQGELLAELLALFPVLYPDQSHTYVTASHKGDLPT